jgi:hypothetical protein
VPLNLIQNRRIAHLRNISASFQEQYSAATHSTASSRRQSLVNGHSHGQIHLVQIINNQRYTGLYRTHYSTDNQATAIQDDRKTLATKLKHKADAEPDAKN